MNLQLLNVTNAGSEPDRRPGLRFYGHWLSEIGFVPGALVRVIPEPGGMKFTLHNEYIISYSELNSLARKHGGKLIQVSYPNAKKMSGPSLRANGRHLRLAGLDIGDEIIIQYDYGFIQARKLPDRATVVLTAKVKNQDTGKPGTKAKLSGNWLPKFGFMPKTLVTTLSEPGQITLQPYDVTAKKRNDFRSVWPSPTKLVLVRETLDRGKLLTNITVPDYCLDEAGFTFGDVLFASSEKDLITLHKLDFEKLGFCNGKDDQF